MSEAYMQLMIPSLVALAGASVVAMATSLLPRSHAVVLQGTFFAGALAVSVGYLSTQPYTIERILLLAKSCSDEVRFALTVFIIAIAYFGGSFYVTGKDPKEKAYKDMPASCDIVVDFDVPSSIPKEDQALFLQLFDS
jgi:hypothetical protein